MARYKDYSYDQGKMIPVYFKDQILTGTFETITPISFRIYKKAKPYS